MRRVGRAVTGILTVVGMLSGGIACSGQSGAEPESAREQPGSVAVSPASTYAAQTPKVVVAAVGDISPPRMGNQRATARLVQSWNPKSVLVLGDLQYRDGRLADFRKYYGPTWGRLMARTRPVPGNHEYHQKDARGYKDYFGKRAMPRGHTYYSFNLNGWHMVALNSELGEAGSKRQLAWLRADLQKNRQRCVLAYWHSPRFSSGWKHGSDPTVAPLWNALHKVRADVILNGHEHNYERFGRQTPGAISDARGIRQFVVGTGGVGRYTFGKAIKNSQVRHSKYFGALKLTLEPQRYSWQFVSVDGKVRDSGTTACH